MKKSNELSEQIITTNYYMLQAITKGDTKGVIKNKALLDNLIKLYLKIENQPKRPMD